MRAPTERTRRVLAMTAAGADANTIARDLDMSRGAVDQIRSTYGYTIQKLAGLGVPVVVPVRKIDRHPISQRDLMWTDSALCAQVDPELFFPDKGGSTPPPARPSARSARSPPSAWTSRCAGSWTTASTAACPTWNAANYDAREVPHEQEPWRDLVPVR